MNPRRVQLSLRAAAIACAAAVPFVIAAGWLTPAATATDAARSPARARPTTAATAPSSAPPPEAFGAALDRKLRPSLGEASPAATGPTTPAAVEVAALPRRLTLIGTVGESVALIRGPDGTVALIEVGDDVEGADVVAIRAQQVDLRQGGRMVRLQKAPPPPADGQDIVVH